MKHPRNSFNGWINLNKPLGITSADAVNKVKWLLKPQKIGHAGTLDPLATGVLPLALGEGTKCVNLLMDAKKTYEFSVTFGERRSTDDAEGEVVASSDKIPTEEEIRKQLPAFTGPIMQTPPIYSALKVAGKRAYDLARAGEEVVLVARPVTIHALEFLGFEGAQLSMDDLPIPSPNPLPQGERVSSRHCLESTPSAMQGFEKFSESGAAGEALSPWGRGLGEGTGSLPAYVPLAKHEQAIDRAQAMRHVSTEAEQRLWGILRGRRLDGFKFRRQHPFGHYIADFICLEQNVVIEIDGESHAHAQTYDTKRTAYFESQGFNVIRFWNNEVLGNIEGVATTIRSKISRPLTQPSPPRGEGSPAAPSEPNNPLGSALKGSNVARFRATVSKGTYIRSLGRDIAQNCGSEGYISRLHRAAVGPFTDTNAISLDFLANSVHKAPLPDASALGILPLHAALDDIPALALDGQQWNQLRHGQRVTLTAPQPDAPLIAVTHNGDLVGLARVASNQVIAVRLLNL